MRSLAIHSLFANKPMRFQALLILLLFNLIHLTSEANNFMSVSQNRKYLNSGTLKIDLSSAIIWNPYAVNVTYPFSFNSTVEGIFLSINDMNLDNNGGNLSFYGVANSFTQTFFTLYVYSNTSSKIKSLGYRYTAIAVKDASTYGWILRTVVQTMSISMSYYYYCNTYGVSVPLGSNYSLGFSVANQYALSFLGYDINSQSYFFSLGIKLTEGVYTNVTSLSA